MEHIFFEKTTIPPIRAALMDRQDLTPEDLKEINELKSIGEKINDEKGNGREDYFSTKINEKPKYSTDYIMCTGVVAVGKSTENGKQLSFLTHNLFPSLNSEEKDLHTKKIYQNNFTNQLENFISLVDKNSIDIVILGGVASGNKTIFKDPSWQNYKDAVLDQSKIIENILGIKPLVITGPQDWGRTDVYLDTQNRRLFIIREKQENSKRNEHYDIDSFDKQKKKW